MRITGPMRSQAPRTQSHIDRRSRWQRVSQPAITGWLRSTLAISHRILPRWWVTEALCIHRHEAMNWHQTTTWQGYPSDDTGGLQIETGTWDEMAPSGYPQLAASASPWQQLVVAYRIWTANGRSFGGNQWPLSSESCGLQ